jgi:hypothetical protein
MMTTTTTTIMDIKKIAMDMAENNHFEIMVEEREE